MNRQKNIPHLDNETGRHISINGVLQHINVDVSLDEYAAGVRWETEIGGITVSSLPVATDDRSKSLIQGAYLKALRDENFVTGWKTPSGFIPLTAAQVEGIALSVAAHVQACFAKEAEVLAAIDDETIETYEEIDAAFVSIVTAY